MNVSVLGLAECLAAFEELPMGLQNRHMRIALNAAGGVIRDAAVSNSPEDSGAHKKALQVKVRVPNASRNRAHHGKPAYAIVGAARHIVGVQTFRKSGAKGRIKTVRLKRGQKLATNVRRPSRYSHLIERDTRFLSRAVGSAGQLAQNKMVHKLKDGIHEFVVSRRSRMSLSR